MERKTPTKESSVHKRGFMHHKNIKLIVQKQLKKQFPNWNRLNRKTKKEIGQKVLAEAVSGYDFTGNVVTSAEELLGIEQQVPAKGIIKLKEMAQLIDKVTGSRIIKFSNYKRSSKYITDKELHFIDKLIDDGLVPMLHVGIEAQKHEYKCSAASGECKFSSTCSHYRIIPVDGGLFQRIPFHTAIKVELRDFADTLLLIKASGYLQNKVEKPIENTK